MVYVPKYKSKKSRTLLNPKKDSITLEQAKERFNEYYNTRSKSKTGRIRSKIGDIRYNKTDPSRVLRPNEPGSAKYMLPEGPRTFDMVGVDYFPEGTEYAEIDDPEFGIIKVKLKGVPKLKTGDTFSSHFKNKYSERKNKTSPKGNFEDGQNLVNLYWDEHYKKSEDEGIRIKRPRAALKNWDFKRKGEHITESYFLLGKNEIFFEYGDNIYYLDSNMKVYDHDHKFINKLKDMPIDFMQELENQGYIELTSAGYPKWTDNIYQWVIFYKYITPSGEEKKIKLNMKDMTVRDINTDAILDDWNVYLTKNNLDYKKIVPYDMIKTKVISAEPIISKIDDELDIAQIERIRADEEYKLREMERIHKMEEDTLKKMIEDADIEKQKALDEMKKQQEIADAAAQQQLLAEEEAKKQKLLEEEANQAILLAQQQAEKQAEIDAEIKRKEAENEFIRQQEIAAKAEQEKIIALQEIEKQEQLEKEAAKQKLLAEQEAIRIAEQEKLEEQQRLEEEKRLEQKRLDDELLEKQRLEEEKKRLEEEQEDLNKELKEEEKEEDEELIGDIEEESEEASAIEQLGYKLVEHNGKKYYLEEDTNRYISDDAINYFKDLLEYETDYDVLDAINADIINKDMVPYIENIENNVETIVENLEAEKKENNVVTVSEDILSDLIDNVLKKTPESKNEAVENILSNIVEENKDITNVAPEILVDTLESNKDRESSEIFNELKENSSPVLSIDLNDVKETLEDSDISIDAIEEMLNGLQENDTDDIPINKEDIDEIQEDTILEEDDIDEIQEDTIVEEDEKKKELVEIKITPSIEDYRYREFKKLLVNVKPQNMKSSDNDRLSEITKYIYDSFHNNPKQDDEVFPNVIDVPKMKYVDNEKFKKEMNELVKNIRKYKENYKVDTEELIQKKVIGVNYELVLIKNKQIVGDKVIITKSKYDLLVSRIIENMSEMSKDKIIWSLYYRYTYILPKVPQEYKDKCRRIIDDNIPKKYESMYYDLEKYFGSEGMC